MFRSGDLVDHYRLTELLGSGAYGTVFAAENTVSHTRCAIKIVPLCGRAGARELRALRQYHDINHPNLLKIHHSGTSGDYLYYTMDLADGKLAQQHLTPAQLRCAAVKLADALAALHEHGLIHRDIKPDNLFFLDGEVLIGDIGLLTADCGASLTGTPGFLPPQVRKNGTALSEFSDCYALAKSLYCLLSGNPPGDYPRYAGPMEPDAAILLQAVLSVCDDEGKITSAARFRDFLQTAKLPNKRLRAWSMTAGSFCAVALVLAGAWHFRTRHLKDSRYEQMTAAILAAKYSPAERTAIKRQREVYRALRNEVRAQMRNSKPPGEMTSINAEIKEQFAFEELLEKKVKKYAAENPEFHCFYVLENEQEEFLPRLAALIGHPEHADSLEKDFQIWQRKYADYCRERDRLLK